MHPTMIFVGVLFGLLTPACTLPVKNSTGVHEGKVRLKRKYSDEIADYDDYNAMDRILEVNSSETLLKYVPVHSSTLLCYGVGAPVLFLDAVGMLTVIYLLRAPRGLSFRDGDIASSYLRSAITCPGNACLWPKSVDGFVYVPFMLSPLYDDMDRITIETGMQDIASGTCVQFVPRTHEVSFLDIQPRYGCWSFLGQTGGSQTLSLQTPGCMWSGVAAHEFMHALGFVHEQSRSDRDHYVSIVWKNIMPDHIHNFRKQVTNNLNSPYDYNSVMHYGRYAFSEEGGPTIIPRPDPYIPIGQRDGPSNLDLHKINVLYNCGVNE